MFAHPVVVDETSRACATVIPTKIVQGKLWLFPDSSPQGVEASKHVEPALVPGLDLVCIVYLYGGILFRLLEIAQARSAPMRA